MKKDDDFIAIIINHFVALKNEISRIRSWIQQLETRYPTFKPATIVDEKSTEEVDEFTKEINEFQEEFTRNNQGKSITDFNSNSYRLFCRLLTRTLRKLTTYFTAYDGTRSGSDSLFDGAKQVLNERRRLYDQLCRAQYSLSEKNDLLEYELQLEERECQSHSTNLLVLKNKYSTVLTPYLQQCIDFHEHFDAIDVHQKVIGLLNPTFTDEQQRDQLTRALEHLRIPLTSPNLRIHSNVKHVSEQSSDQNSFTSFIPSKAIAERRSRTLDVHVDTIIRDHRWLVLLGSPGSGKTTLARWLTHTFARAVLQDSDPVSIGEGEEKKYLGLARLPILIRVNEFTDWLQHNPTLTLFDYIGRHTWFDQLYLKEEFDMIQDFVRHSHALIILIGLDEVTTSELRSQVLKSIHDFINTYVLSSEFISAYDDIKLAKMWPTQEDRWEGLQGGNMVIITSRIADYDVQPLQSELITHCIIAPMCPSDISDFVNTWHANVQTRILSLISTITSEPENNQSGPIQDWFDIDKLLDIINSRKDITTWASNRRLLSILCTLYARQGDQIFENKRFYLYEQIVELMLQQLRTEIHMFKFILSRLALHIQLHSTSGLIDEFDLKTLCRVLLKEWNDQNRREHYSLTPSELRCRTEEFLQHLKKDTGMIAAPHLSVYGFFHSSFQEYFASISMIKLSLSPEELAVRFCSVYSQPRMRSLLLLAMSNISLRWDVVVFDQFCEYLISYDSLCNKYVPVGALLLLVSLPDLARLPSQSIVFKALDTLLLADDDDEPETCRFQSSISSALDVVPVPMVERWFKEVLFRNVVNRLKILSMTWNTMSKRETLPRWIKVRFSRLFWNCLSRFEEKVDVYIQQCLTMINMNTYIRRSEDMFRDLRSYLWDKANLVANMDPLILAAIIILYGGPLRTKSRGRQVSVTFSPQRMYRDSPLSPVFINCFNNTANQTSRIQFLINECHQIVHTAALPDISLQMVHAFVVLLCLKGLNQLSNYDQYKNHKALQLAIRHLKLIRIDLHDHYINMKLVDAIDFTTIVQQIVNEDQLVIGNSLVHAFGSLVCNKYCLHKDLPSYKMDRTRLVNVKLSISFDQRRFLHYDEAMRLNILSSVYSIPPRMCGSFDDIEELEKNDIDLLQHEQHPFQLLQDHPTLLLIAYLPKHVQPLYTHLMKNSTPLLLVHLLIKFVTQIQHMELSSLRLWILLTVLEPIFIEYRMMNFLRMTIHHAVHTITDESVVYLINTIEKQCYVEPLVKKLLPLKNSENRAYSTNAAAEEEGVQLSTDQNDNNSNDLRIYTTSIDLATRTDDELSSAEAWSAVANIKDSLWRLDASIVLSRINVFLKKKLRNENYLLIEFNEILENIEFPLVAIAILVGYLPYLERISSSEKDQLICKIFDRMQTISTYEQQMVCQALAHFSSFRPLICQFIRRSNWANESDAFINIFSLNSVRFAQVFHSSSFEFPNNISVLISSMYLNELAFDVQVLQNWFDRDFGEDVLSHSTTSLILFEECLLELSKQIEAFDQSILSSMIIEKINICLSSSRSEIDKSRLQMLNLLLRHFNELQDKSASESIAKWLTWQSDSDLQPFVYHSALLLAQYGLWICPILDICCELLTSDDDFFRRQASTVIKTYRSLDCHIILWIKKWNTYSREIIIRVRECLRCSFSVNQSDDIDLIIQEERNRFDIRCADNSRSFFLPDHQISIFELIADMTVEATEYMNEIIHSLPISNDSTDYRFFLWIINYNFSNPFLSKQIGTYVDYLLKCIQSDHDKDIKIAASRALVWCSGNDYLCTLWGMIKNNSSNIDESVLIACFQSLCYSRERSIEEQELNDPVACSIDEVYSSHIINATYYLFHHNETQNRTDTPVDNAARWIIKYSSELLTKFVRNTFESMSNNDEIRVFDARLTYITVADLICDEISDEFIRAVRQSSFGEQSFKNALYTTSKKFNRYRQRYICLDLYSRFEEITDQYISMLMELALEDNIEANSDYSLLRSITSKMQTLYDRDIVETLLSTMQSISLCQRWYAAKLLYRLVMADQLSVIELQQALVAAIEDPWSHQKSLHRFSKGRLDSELKLLLHQLLLSKDPQQQIQLPPLVIFDQSISRTFPTLSFSPHSIV